MTSKGLYEQINQSNKAVYEPAAFSLETFRGVIQGYFSKSKKVRKPTRRKMKKNGTIT